jgi:hypothetical protein
VGSKGYTSQNLNERNDMTDHDKTITIIIDKKEYKAPEPVMTGSQLRQLPQPPIGAEYDFFQIVPGGNDPEIADDESVHLKRGDRFFSAPHVINPGGGW